MSRSESDLVKAVLEDQQISPGDGTESFDM
jgi:hypothetical protein